ncbi:LOW QUALITY PROTEIN: hypothetical protein YC2023_117119 [Brassica napus]
MRADTQSLVWLDITGQRTHQSYFKNVARVREREKVVELRVWSILKTDTPPRRLLLSNRRFSTIVTLKLCPIQSVQAKSAPLMMKWRCCQELFQFHGFRSVEVLLDSPPPKNCPGAKGRSVQISLSRPIGFFMVKPRFCPSQDQSSPVQSRRSSGVLAKSSPINQLLLT